MLFFFFPFLSHPLPVLFLIVWDNDTSEDEALMLEVYGIYFQMLESEWSTTGNKHTLV